MHNTTLETEKKCLLHYITAVVHESRQRASSYVCCDIEQDILSKYTNVHGIITDQSVLHDDISIATGQA